MSNGKVMIVRLIAGPIKKDLIKCVFSCIKNESIFSKTV